MHILVFPGFQLHWLDFMHLYQAGIWQEGGMNTVTVWQSWKRKMNGTGGSFKHRTKES